MNQRNTEEIVKTTEKRHILKEETKNKIKKTINFILRTFLIFFIGSIIGFFVEIVYGLITHKVLMIRKGLLYGPFIQVYGAGAVAYYILTSYVKETKKVFLVGMIMGGIIEYIFSFLQEIIFGTSSWDYSHMILNINGRTCVLYCIFWGILGVVYLKAILPYIQKLDELILNKGVKIITCILLAFMIFDVTISCMAGIRQNERRKNIPPDNKLESFIDKKYPDEYMDKVYINKKEL